MPGHYRAEIIGPLPRPPYLVEASLRLHHRPPIPLHGDAPVAVNPGQPLSLAEYKRIEDRAVDHLIALTGGRRLDVNNDGEMRRVLFPDALSQGVEGVENTPAPDAQLRLLQDGVFRELWNANNFVQGGAIAQTAGVLTTTSTFERRVQFSLKILF